MNPRQANVTDIYPTSCHAWFYCETHEQPSQKMLDDFNITKL